MRDPRSFLPSPGRPKTWLALGACLSWFALIFALSSQSTPFLAMDGWLGLERQHVFFDIWRTIRQVHGYDKYLHAFFWSMLTLLLWWASASFAFRSLKRRVLFVFVIASCWACLDECHQYFVPQRAWSFSDMMADLLGSVLVLSIIYGVQRVHAIMRVRMLERQGG